MPPHPGLWPLARAGAVGAPAASGSGRGQQLRVLAVATERQKPRGPRARASLEPPWSLSPPVRPPLPTCGFRSQVPGSSPHLPPPHPTSHAAVSEEVGRGVLGNSKPWGPEGARRLRYLKYNAYETLMNVFNFILLSTTWVMADTLLKCQSAVSERSNYLFQQGGRPRRKGGACSAQQVTPIKPLFAPRGSSLIPGQRRAAAPAG